MNGINNLANQLAALEVGYQAQPQQDGFVTPPNQGVRANPHLLNAPGRVQPQAMIFQGPGNPAQNHAARIAHMAALAARILGENNQA